MLWFLLQTLRFGIFLEITVYCVLHFIGSHSRYSQQLLFLLLCELVLEKTVLAGKRGMQETDAGKN